jgi:UDP-N-acetylmuramate dehydrogenase
MPLVLDNELTIERDAELPTWFKVGGRADSFVRARTPDDVRQCLELDRDLRVLGDGANLLVDDAGITNLVLAFHDPADAAFPMSAIRWGDGSTPTYAGAGALLFRIIPEAVRRGLAGLEGLGGVPASVGGACVMNAGGTFGQIADVVVRIHAMDRRGNEVMLERREIDFGYRRSGLARYIILGAELNLTPSDPAKLREHFKEVMEYKKRTQPMEANSAGCAFKNPVLASDVEGVGARGQRVSAGMLIDRAGCKGLRIGSAEVSMRHGNFIFAYEGGRASDVIAVIDEVRRRVLDRFGVTLENEVVIWRRESRH